MVIGSRAVIKLELIPELSHAGNYCTRIFVQELSTATPLTEAHAPASNLPSETTPFLYLEATDYY